MFRRLARGWRHSRVILQALPNGAHRRLMWRMVRFSWLLPQQFNQPLPELMVEVTPSSQPESAASLDDIRQLADAVAAWHLRSPVGICLRRSLLRYHFLREAGLPVDIVFGARLKGSDEGGGIGGHAWLTLHGQPYYENPGDFEGFVKMYVYPEPINQRDTGSRFS